MSGKDAPYPAWIYRQSAVLPYRWRGGRLQVLLITSRRGKRWVLPKGIVDPGLHPALSALKEAREEAGIAGPVHEQPLGSYRYRKWGGTCEVVVYPMQVDTEHTQWPESFRRRRWRSFGKARRKVRGDLGALMGRLPEVAAKEGAAPGDALDADTPPPRLVYVFRHAKSSWSDPALADEQRPLAPRGRRACEAMARYMALGDVHPDLVLCSSARRTRETLEAVHPALGEGVEVEYGRDLYLASAGAMLDRLRVVADEVRSVMILGHLPGVQWLALGLAGGGDEAAGARMARKFPTGALAALVFRGDSWSGLGNGTCELHSFVAPRDIGEDP